MSENEKQTIVSNENFVAGNEVLAKLQGRLEDQHGEKFVTEELRIARLERDLIDSIIRARKYKKLTQKDLALILDTKAQQISKYERTEQIPSLSVLLKLCDALDLELCIRSKEDQSVIFHS